MTCNKCGSNNVTVSVDHTAAARKKNGCLYWIFIGWWYHFFYWLIFKVWLNLFRRITNKGSKATVYKEHKTAICQDCGNSWKMK
jgi:hypothetical protein